jgi:hypothetical protein
MQKKLILSLVLVAMLTMVVAMAAAPAPAPVISLVTYGFYQEKGITFKFTSTSALKDMSGSLSADGETFKLRCYYQSERKQYYCHAPAGTASKKGGMYGVVTFSGSSFGVIVPTKANIILLKKNR